MGPDVKQDQAGHSEPGLGNKCTLAPHGLDVSAGTFKLFPLPRLQNADLLIAAVDAEHTSNAP